MKHLTTFLVFLLLAAQCNIYGQEILTGVANHDSQPINGKATTNILHAEKTLNKDLPVLKEGGISLVPENTKSATGDLTVSVGGGGRADFSVTPNPLVFPTKGGCIDMTVTTDGSGWLATYDSKLGGFVNQLPVAQGDNTSTFTVCASENKLPIEFTSNIKFTSNGQTINVLVSQEAVKEPLAVFFEEKNAVIKYEGDTYQGRILTNTDWKLIQQPYDTWVNIKSIKSGTENSDFIFTVEKNSTWLNRFARIGLVYNNALDTSYFIVSQPGQNSWYVNVPADITAGVFKSVESVNIYSDLEWEVTEISSGWMEVSPKKGKGNSILDISIADNNTGNERTGEITVVGKIPGGGTITKTIKVNQFKLRSDFKVMDYKVFPNPASDYIDVALNSEEASTLDIALMSTSGILVKHLEKGYPVQGEFRREYSLNGVAPGYYTLMIKYGDKVKREKLIIIN